MEQQNIVQLFISAAGSNANGIAFIEGNRKITYAQLLQQVQATAAYHIKNGIDKDDKVLVFIPMKTKLYVIVLALLYIGACPVFLDEWVSISRLKECLKTVPCKAIVAEKKLLFVSLFISPLRKLIKLGSTVQYSLKIMNEPIPTWPGNTALVTFTTGSTGIPKAANRTHSFLNAQRNALHPLLAEAYQITLTLLPVVVLLNLSLGKTNVLPVKKIAVSNAGSVNYALQLIQRHCIKSIIASPAIMIAIAKGMIQHRIATSIGQVITGGGPVFPDEAQIMINGFPQADASVVYGSTEAEPISIINMKDLVCTAAETMQSKGLPVGVLHSDIRIAIILYTTDSIPDQSIDEWEKQQLRFGNSGEIIVSGPHVLQAYLNNNAAQRQNKFFVNETLWHRTGDEGMLDEKSNLYFRGRCTEIINYGEHIIYPILNAWLLQQKVAVQEAAILLMNNKLLLVLEQKNKLLQAQIIAAIQGTSLEGATICYLPSMPKDKRHNTKIDYEKLRQLLG